MQEEITNNMKKMEQCAPRNILSCSSFNFSIEQKIYLYIFTIFLDKLTYVIGYGNCLVHNISNTVYLNTPYRFVPSVVSTKIFFVVSINRNEKLSPVAKASRDIFFICNADHPIIEAIVRTHASFVIIFYGCKTIRTHYYKKLSRLHQHP